MFKTFRVLKSYYKLAKVKWQFVLLEFIVLLIPSLLSIITPILTANVISSITVYDFKNAIYMLSLDFGIIVLTAFSYFAYHFFQAKITRMILLGTNEYIYDIIKENKNINKVNSSTMSDIWQFSNFNSNLLYKVCFLIKSIIILAIIFYYNFIIGASLILVSIVSAFLLSITNKQIQKNTLLLNESKVKSLELFNSIQKGVSIENNNFMESTMKYKYFDRVDTSVKTNNKITLFYNLNNNFISLILKTAVFLFTFYLITLIKSTYLTLPVYLVLTPYLTSSAQNLIAFFEIFPEVGLVENIMHEFDKLKIDTSQSPNEIQTQVDSYDIKLFHASLKQENYSIIDADIDIPFKSIVQIIGVENSGKRAICDLITKKYQANSGSVFLGNINVNDIDIKNYNQLLYITYKIPYFYNISIMENLMIVCESKTKITKCLKEFNIFHLINELPNSTNSVIGENFPQKLLFFLGIVRAYLSNPKIICIYEIPDNFVENDFKLFSEMINTLNKKSTVILFLHQEIKNIENYKTIFIDRFKIK